MITNSDSSDDVESVAASVQTEDLFIEIRKEIMLIKERQMELNEKIKRDKRNWWLRLICCL